MKSTWKHFYALFFAAVLPTMLSTSCNKMLSDIIPKDEQRLIRLELKNVDRLVCSTSTDIRDHAITVTVPKGTDVTHLLPEAVISPQATLFPVTLRYLQEAFPATDVLKLGFTINSFENKALINQWFFELYAENPNFNIPPLIFPINFLSPVSFAVIGGQGKIELYTVTVVYDDGTLPGATPLPPEKPSEAPAEEPSEAPPERNILSFSVGDPQIDESIIGTNTVEFSVTAGTEIRGLTVTASVSEGAILIPLTEPYLVPVLTSLGMDPLSVLSGYITAPDKEGFLRALFGPVDISNLTVPLDKPIDFTNPVQFAVVGKDKEVKLYTVTCIQTVTRAVLKQFGFSKVKNPALVKDGKVSIDRTAKMVEAELLYPVEYTASEAFSLYYDAAYAGESAVIEYKGIQYNAADKIPFIPENPPGSQYHLGTAEAKIIITFGAERAEYRLLISFKEDPDTVRSITDFRFTKEKNSEIKILSMAAIVNDGHEGSITATVLYTGTKPETLIPSFVSPGTVSVNGAPQTSGIDRQNFRQTLTYLCTSRNGQYTRRYTVKVRFVYTEPSLSVLKTFRFLAGANQLSQDAEGSIDHTTHTVRITVHYAGQKPETLIPEFSATGEVTVYGLTQSSGFSAQDFEYPVYYKVTAVDDPQTYTIYTVTVTCEYTADSGCELTEFKLLQQDNPSLTKDIEAVISPHSGNIYALVPQGADIHNLIPRFTAQGRVTVDDSEQISGETPCSFASPVVYKVTSGNGLYTKTYLVTLRQASGIIYVDPKASGRNNGSTWEDAFTSFDTALQTANALPAEMSAEIWLTKDFSSTGKQYELTHTLTLRGGFSGIEHDAAERNKNNKTAFQSAAFSSQTALRGALVFDSIAFTENTGKRDIIKGIQWVSGAEENTLVIENCSLIGTFSVEPSTRLTSVTVKDTVITDTEKIERKSTFKLQCNTAHIENCTILNDASSAPHLRIDRRIFDINRETEPAESVTIKNSRFAQYWNQQFTTAAITVEQVTASNSFWFITGSKNIHLTGVIFINQEYEGRQSQIQLIDCNDASVSIKDSTIKQLSLRKSGSSVEKLRSVSIRNSQIGVLESNNQIIAQVLYWKNDGFYHSQPWGAPSNTLLQLAACSVTLQNLRFIGDINTICDAGLFRQVMESVPVSTKMSGVSARSIACGYSDGSKKSFNNTAYTLDGSTVTYPSLCSRSSELIDFKCPGMQTFTAIEAKQITVLSGEQIDVDCSFTHINSESYSRFASNDYITPECDCYIRNEKSSNSSVRLNVNHWAVWIRVITNTANVRGDNTGSNAGSVSSTNKGMMEIFGYKSVNVASGRTKLFADGASYTKNGQHGVLPGFLAIGAAIKIEGSFYGSVTQRKGTVFDILRKDTYRCVVGIRQ